VPAVLLVLAGSLTPVAKEEPVAGSVPVPVESEDKFAFFKQVSACVLLIRKIECVLCFIYTNFVVVILYVS
jgi:hypothetical protein